MVSLTIFVVVFSDLFRLRSKMLPPKQAEEAMVPSFDQAEPDNREEEDNEKDNSGISFKSFLWHGGSVYDAWFSCASNQVLPHNNFYFYLKKKPIIEKLENITFVYRFSEKANFIFIFFKYTGCSGSFDTAVLFLSTGCAFRHNPTSFLRHSWELDCLFNQYSLCRISKPKRERECQLQKPCHPG